jgi:invasion protein IalB
MTSMPKSTKTFSVGYMLSTLALAVATSASAQQPAARPAPQRPAQSAQTSPPAQTGNPSQSPAAQSAAPQPSVGNGPQRTTATYEDWIVQCETQAGTPPRKVCEMAQLTQLQVQGRAQPFSRMIVPQPAKNAPGSLFVQVPVNVTFATKVKILASESDQGIEVPFTRCVPDGCFAEFPLAADSLAKLRAASSGAKLSFADSTGQVVAIPLSFKGFAKGYDALLKE